MRRIVLAVLTVSLMSGSGQAGSLREGTMEEYRPAVTIIAKGVSKVMKSRKEGAIMVGVFTGPDDLGTAAGAGIKQLIIEELSRLDVRVEVQGAALALSGKYQLAAMSEDLNSKQIQLEVKLTDGSGHPLTDLASSVTVPKNGPQIHKDAKNGTIKIDTRSSAAAMAVAMGLTVDFETLESLNVDLVKETLKQPTAYIRNGNELRASKESEFGLQVLVDGEPGEITLIHGQPHVDLEEGDIFHLHLVSQATYGISTVFTLDGVNSFAFSEIREFGRPKYSQFLFAGPDELELKGWHINNEKVREFKLTDFSKSAAAKIGTEGSLGTINVLIRSTWFKGQKIPPGDGPRLTVGSAGPGVGLGDETEQVIKEDNKPERQYGKPRAVMTIRYTHPKD